MRSYSSGKKMPSPEQQDLCFTPYIKLHPRLIKGLNILDAMALVLVS